MTYAERLQTCLRCEHSGPRKAACARDGLRLHDHATGAACPDGLFPAAATPITVKGNAPAPVEVPVPASPETVAARLAACRECEHSGAEGADARSVYCATCKTCNGGRGRMVSLTIGRCPLAIWL